MRLGAITTCILLLAGCGGGYVSGSASAVRPSRAWIDGDSVNLATDWTCSGLPSQCGGKGTIVAPGGERFVAYGRDDGAVVFYIDDTSPLYQRNLFDPKVQAALRRPWTFSLSRRGGASLEGNWTPTHAEVQDILVTPWQRRRGMAVTDYGGDPVLAVEKLVPEVAPLRAGFRARMVLRVCNTGVGPARHVYATTRSATSGLHRLVFLIGDVDARACNQQIVETKLPAGPDRNALVVVQLAEKRGQVPTSDYSTRLDIEPSTARLCDKQLTRAQYYAKLSELHGLRDQGALTAAQVEAMEIELVGCLQ